jgi:hypothetical protein
MYATLLNVTTQTLHGGARDGAGRKSLFAEKALAKPFAMDFTVAGRRELDALVARTGLSRNGVLAWLALKYADQVAFDVRAPFPNKARRVCSIRVPPEAGAKLAAARVRTGHGYSDIGEALIQFGRLAVFPPPHATIRPRRRRPIRRATR